MFYPAGQYIEILIMVLLNRIDICIYNIVTMCGSLNACVALWQVFTQISITD